MLKSMKGAKSSPLKFGITRIQAAYTILIWPLWVYAL